MSRNKSDRLKSSIGNSLKGELTEPLSAIDHSHGACVIPRGVRRPRQIKLIYALGAVPVAAVLLGAALAAKKPAVEK